MILSVTTIIATVTPTKYDEYAEKLATIGVFKGTGNGFELDRAPTRLEGLVMLIRLLGKEDEAINESLTESNSYFSDAPTWGIPYTNYAYKHGLSMGIGNGLFGVEQPLVAKAYYTFVLRALGYDDSSGDFNYNDAIDYALSQGVVSQELYTDIMEQEFTRDYVAKVSYDALYCFVKGSNTKLIDTLVQSGDIDAATAALVEIKKTSVVIIGLDKEAEYVKIQNMGKAAVDIGNWVLISEKGNQTFIFPNGYVLQPNQICTVTSGELKGTGDFTMAETTIWNNSSLDPAVLRDVAGNEVSRVEE
jgi:hypothetical protein